MKHETRVAYKTGDETVLLQGIDCTGLSADEHTNIITGIDVKFRFTISEGSFSIFLPQPYHAAEEKPMADIFSSRRALPKENQRNAHRAFRHQPTISPG